MTNLEQKIKTLADAYYQGDEQISDEEYDALIDQLRRENPKSELLPENQGVTGSDIKGVDKKYKLDITMGTLAKCNTDAQMKEWWEKHPHSDIVVETKIDGAGSYIHYENGKLIYARSRGDSEYGTDLTEKLKLIAPAQIDSTFTGNIRGEVVMLRSVFDKYFKDQGFKNPRNTVSGALGQKEIDKDVLTKCTFIAYDVFDDDNKVDTTEQQKLGFLSLNHFTIPEFWKNPTFDELKALKDKIDTKTAEIPCDGIVIKQNKVDKDDLARHTPLNNCAYKPSLQIAVTKVINIEWDIAGRVYAPVAIVEPVELEGTTVQRASIANVNKMLEMGIEIGSMVEIAKHGLIIPQIEKVVA